MIERISPRKLNRDTDDRSLSADEMKKAINISVGIDKDGDSGVVKRVDGTVRSFFSDESIKENELLQPSSLVIGSVADEELGVIYYFVYTPNQKDSIWAYSSKTKTHRCIMSSDDLNFQPDGFVKADIARIKRVTEGVPPSIIPNQGEDGGNTDFGEGGNEPPPPPPDAVPPITFRVEIERDLYPLIEIDRRISSLNEALDVLNQAQWEVTITGTNGIRFYNQFDDFNEVPVGEEQVVLPMTFGATEDNKSVFISVETDLYLDPSDVENNVGNIEFEIDKSNSSFRISVPPGVGSGTNSGIVQIRENVSVAANTSNPQNNSQPGYFSVGSEGTSFLSEYPVLRFPNKTRSTLFVNDVFGTGSIVNVLDDYLLRANEKMGLYGVTEGTQDDFAINGNTTSLKFRSIPVRIRIDYRESEGYKAMRALYEAQQTLDQAPDDWPESGAAIGRSQRLIPDDAVTDAIFAVWCPAQLKYRLMEPSSNVTIESINAGDPLAWGAFQTQAASAAANLNFDPSIEELDYGFHGNYASMQSAVTASRGQQIRNDGSFAWAIVEIATFPGIPPCGVIDPKDLFKPTLVYAPADTDMFNNMVQQRLIVPYDYDDDADLFDLFSKSVYNYVVNVPVEGPIGATGFILGAFNNSEIDSYRFVENIDITNGYDVRLGFPKLGSSDFLNPHGNNPTQPILNFTNDEITVNINVGDNGPTEQSILRGRRAIVSTRFENEENIVTSSAGYNADSFTQILGGDGSMFPAIGRMFPGSFDNNVYPTSSANSSFCFDFALNCSASSQRVKAFTDIPPAPDIEDGDDPRIIAIRQDDRPEKDTKPVVDTPSPVSTQTTKKTIKKKY